MNVFKCGQVHCLHSLLPPATNYSVRHRPKGHPFQLPHYIYIFIHYQDGSIVDIRRFGAYLYPLTYNVGCFIFSQAVDKQLFQVVDSRGGFQLRAVSFRAPGLDPLLI